MSIEHEYEHVPQQPHRNGLRGHRWFSSEERCKNCHARIQTDGYGNKFCGRCEWVNGKVGLKGLRAHRKLALECGYEVDGEFRVLLPQDEENVVELH